MKPLLLTLAIMSALALRAHADDANLSAQELAYHIGISSWVSEVRLQGSGMVLQICHVVDGKVVATLLENSALPLLDREQSRVAILASQTPKGTQLSIQIPDGLAVKYQTGHIPLEMTVRLPATISEGDYVLGGDIRDIDLKTIRKRERSIEDLKNGIVLRVTRQSPPSR